MEKLMNTICSPYDAVPSLLGQCFSDIYLTFLPECTWSLLIVLEFMLRKKETSHHPPLSLVAFQILHLLLDFLGLTLLLFYTQIELVSLASVLSYISQLFLWITVLYSYQISYKRSGWALTHMITLKAFIFIRIPWIFFRLFLYWMQLDDNISEIYILKAIQVISWATSLIFILLLIIGWVKGRRVRSRSFLLIEEEPYSHNTEEMHLPNTEEMRLPNTEEMRLPNTDEIHLRNTEEIHMRNTDEIHLRNTEEHSSRNTEENSYEQSSIFSKILMIFIYKLLKLGYRKHLEEPDIEKPRKEETTEYQKSCIKSYIQRYLSRKNDRFALLKAVYMRFLKEIICLVIIGAFGTLMEFTAPVFIMLLEGFLMGDQPRWRGFALASYLLITKITQAIANNHFTFHSALLGGHIKAGLSSVIYEKSLKVSSTTISSTQEQGASYTYAQIVNLIQVDLERIATNIPFSMRAVIWPFQMAIGLYLLYLTVRWQGTSASMAVMIILFFVNWLAAKCLGRIQNTVMKKKDKRMKYCTELLNNIKVFKLYNWEKKIGERVKEARADEMKYTVKYLRFLIMVLFINWGTRNYIVISILVALIIAGYPLNAGEIFAGITVIEIINMNLKLIPDIINNYINLVISLKRIQGYLQCQEVVNYLDSELAEQNRDVAVAANLASFSWYRSGAREEEIQETNLILKDITYSIKKGEFVAIVGRVGSGKSSVLHSIIQNMNFIKTDDSSSVFVNGTTSYVAQEAWIQNGTIKENILFGHDFEEDRYHEVIRVSQLQSDLEILPGGDQTEIGERGINLSGGQKTRVALARAIYADHDILLLDDPLSAVDAHVGNEIFHECFMSFSRDKTRVLVTNNQQFLPQVDRIIVLNNGRLVETGTYNELINQDSYFANEFLVDLKNQELEESKSSAGITGSESVLKVEKTSFGPTKITENEERSIGRIDFWVYKVFFKYMGGCIVMLIIIFFMLCWQADRMYTDLYLGEWTEQSDEEQEANVLKNILIYSIGSITINIFILFRMIIIVAGVIRAAKTIFLSMLKALLNAPVNNYYDVTTIGRILNKLSKDQFVIDESMSFMLNSTIGQFFIVFTLICMCCFIVPYVLAVVPIALLLSIVIQQFYLASSRELIRLERMSRSPIVHHFSETISGTNTIRAFGYQSQFVNKNSSLINNYMGIYFAQQSTNCWLRISLELVSDMILTSSIFIIVANKGWVEPGLVGVLLTYAITLPDNIFFMIVGISYLENNMVSVERTHQLSMIKGEAPRKRHKDKEIVKGNWPEEGKIEFLNYQMKYRDDTELVLKGVNGVIYPREKIGIVGRTGSGKSSLCLSLFRIIEPYSGTILIDGVDITEIGLDVLRRSMCVIPQEPTLFQGTLRYNIDPFKECSDDQLVEALKLIEIFPDEDPMEVLEKDVSENGSNFSLGQRQLICITRAIVRNSQIMFLDEATASVDYKTDEVIQNIIREKFKDKTILTIAHRINTILDYDRIMVMEKGVIAEFDKPQVLLDQKGLFHKLVKKHKKS